MYAALFVHFFGKNVKEFPERCQAFGVYGSAIAGAVDTKHSADKLEDLINKTIEYIRMVAGAFAFFHADINAVTANVTDFVTVFVNMRQF